jgi:hypothetical protein
MNYTQKDHLDDKIVFQLLQIDQTFFVTCEFLFYVCLGRFLRSLRNMFLGRNQTIVFGKYIKLLTALISIKSLFNRLHFFHEIEKNLFITVSSISIIFLLHMICYEVIAFDLQSRLLNNTRILLGK